MNKLPGEARDGLMRAWLQILHERHPNVTWVPATQERCGDNGAPLAQQRERVQ